VQSYSDGVEQQSLAGLYAANAACGGPSTMLHPYIPQPLFTLSSLRSLPQCWVLGRTQTCTVSAQPTAGGRRRTALQSYVAGVMKSRSS
jgi:hypothetical protein